MGTRTPNSYGENPYELIGRALVTWNRIEALWELIVVVMLDCPRNQADAIFLSLRNFGPQRSMGRELAKITLASSPDTLDRVLKLEKTLGKEMASLRRNAIVHSRYLGSNQSPNLYVDKDKNYKKVASQRDLIEKDVVAELTMTIGLWEILERDTWTTLASVCHCLGKEMP
jgi:hypothetical protein